MTAPAAKPILVAACGNPLAGDDAFGSLVLQHLASCTPPAVELLDLSLNPTALLDHLPGRRALIIVDAALWPGHPLGEIVDLDFFSPDRPQLLSERAVSSHGLSIAHQLELAGALGLGLPRQVRLIALTILPPELGAPPTAAAQSQIARAVQLVLQWAERYVSLPEISSA